LLFSFFQDADGADNLLVTEKLTLLRIKRVLEGELRATQKQLQVFGLFWDNYMISKFYGY